MGTFYALMIGSDLLGEYVTHEEAGLMRSKIVEAEPGLSGLVAIVAFEDECERE